MLKVYYSPDSLLGPGEKNYEQNTQGPNPHGVQSLVRNNHINKGKVKTGKSALSESIKVLEVPSGSVDQSGGQQKEPWGQDQCAENIVKSGIK